MAEEVTIGGEGALFVGEDKNFFLSLPGVDMSGMSILLDVRQKDTSTAAIVSQTADVIGVYDDDVDVNTQRARVILTDTQMNLFRAATYRYSFKRMDDGFETVLAYGDFAPQKATAP